jgi:hypothetical protein
VGQFTVPEVKSVIWVMFEEGNEGKPIWIGGTWLAPNTTNKYSDKVGTEAPETDPNIKVIKTKKAILKINDITGEIHIETTGTITLKGTAIDIDSSNIMLAGSMGVVIAPGLPPGSPIVDVSQLVVATKVKAL